MLMSHSEKLNYLGISEHIRLGVQPTFLHPILRGQPHLPIFTSGILTLGIPQNVFMTVIQNTELP